jgi:hypothetical protein
MASSISAPRAGALEPWVLETTLEVLQANALPFLISMTPAYLRDALICVPLTSYA